MENQKWIVEIEDVKYHVWATGKEDAIKKALAIAVIKAYPYELKKDTGRDSV